MAGQTSFVWRNLVEHFADHLSDEFPETSLADNCDHSREVGAVEVRAGPRHVQRRSSQAGNVHGYARAEIAGHKRRKALLTRSFGCSGATYYQ